MFQINQRKQKISVTTRHNTTVLQKLEVCLPVQSCLLENVGHLVQKWPIFFIWTQIRTEAIWNYVPQVVKLNATGKLRASEICNLYMDGSWQTAVFCFCDSIDVSTIHKISSCSACQSSTPTLVTEKKTATIEQAVSESRIPNTYMTAFCFC